MKQFYFLFFGLFFFQFSFGQIGFENHFVSNYNDRTYNPIGTNKHIVDFEGDGDLDVVLSFYNGVISWYENVDGYGSFSQQKILLDLQENGNVNFKVLDFDNDGDVDVIRYFNNVLYLYTQIDGEAQLSDGVVLMDNLSGSNYKFEDLDGDNDKDIVFSYTSGNLDFLVWSEYLNESNTFGPNQIIDSGTGFSNFNFYLEDMDDDGDFDILRTKDDFILFENVNGDFSNQHIIESNVSSNFVLIHNKDFVIADIDQDGDKDIITNEYLNDMKIYPNLGDNNFGDFQQLMVSYHSYGFDVFDVDMDGDQDIIRGNQVGLYWIVNNNGNFLYEQPLLVNQGAQTIEYSTDIDLDGDIDVLVENYGDIMFQTNSNGTYEGQLTVSMNLIRSKEVISADIDGDLDLDLIATDYNGKIFWFTNLDGMGFFSVQKYVHDNSNFSDDQRKRISVRDLDGDNDNDIISVSTFDGRIVWHENIDGLGTFSDEQIINITFTNKVHSVDVKDIDNDGDNDIVVGTQNGIRWFKNLDGQGDSWQNNQVGVNVNTALQIELNDMDGDNDKDIVCFNNNNLIWFENVDGLGAFGTLNPISTNNVTFPKGVFKIVDMNDDGNQDVIVSSRNNDNISYLKHTDGNGTFEESLIVIDDANGVTSIDIADIDNDGDFDIVAALADLDVVVWYENLDGQTVFSDFNFVSDLMDNTNSYVDQAGFVMTSDINNDNNIDILSVSQTFNNLVWSENLSLVNRISGFVKLTIDLTGNGCVNDNSIPVSNMLVSASNGVENKATFSLNNGNFQLYPEQEGNYVTEIISPLPQYFISNPDTHVSDFIGQGNTDEINYCIEPIGAINDLEISVYPLEEARLGFVVSYQIVYKNVGTTSIDEGLITFDFNSTKMYFQSASEPLFNQATNSLAFQYFDLQPFEIRTIDLNFDIYNTPSVMLGDVLLFEAEITPWTQDITIGNNSFAFSQTVIGSYDPNDIQVIEGDQILLEDADKYLHYIIRFQNTGTASAINVRVENVLDDKLEWTTMQLESLSHSGRVEILDGSDVSFIFNNIYLPDSTSDEPNSHGFIAYKIKPKTTVEVGDIIYNTADIFFDFNSPITTNTVSTEIVTALSIDEYNMSQLEYYPNPVNDVLRLKYSSNIEAIEITDILGNRVYSNNFNASEIELDLSELATSLYFVTIKSENNQMVIKILKE